MQFDNPNIKIVKSNRIRREVIKSGEPSPDGKKTVFDTGNWSLYVAAENGTEKKYNTFYHQSCVDTPSRTRVLEYDLMPKQRSRMPEQVLKPIAIVINVVLIVIILIAFFL